MILVVLGTHELPFTRLLMEVERCKRNGTIQDDVIVQNGHTHYKSNELHMVGFVTYSEMEALYNQSRYIITHAGTGSVTMGIKKNKPVIAVPRLRVYGEHNDDHQLQLVSEFTASGYILSWDGSGPAFEAVIRQAESFIPKQFQSGNDRMFNMIQNFIDEA